MEYLVFAVFSDGQGEVATHSKVWNGPIMKADVGKKATEIIDFICDNGPADKCFLWEVFVFGSEYDHNDGLKAPEQVAYWNLDDGLFGMQEDGLE